jgi:uncharacterized integral membrane protein
MKKMKWIFSTLFASIIFLIVLSFFSSAELESFGGIGLHSSTYTFSSQAVSQGVSQELLIGDSIRFPIKISKTEFEEYKLTLNKLSEDSAYLIIENKSINIKLTLGETKKISLFSEGFYDILIKLESISGENAEITIQTIHELIQIEQPIIPQANTTDTNQNTNNLSSSKFFTKTKIIWGVIIIMVLIILIYIRSLRRNIRSYRPSSPTHFTSYRIVK